MPDGHDVGAVVIMQQKVIPRKRDDLRLLCF